MADEKSKTDEVRKEPDFGVDLDKFSFANATMRISKKDSEIRQREAMKLVRCIISPTHPDKQSYSGEIFCVRNKVSEGVKKFVQFRSPTHIPKILYNMLKHKKCQLFKKEYIDGKLKVTPYLINAYNIEVLPPLTPEEFNAIRDRQLAEGKSIEAR